ncbi:trehalose-phosphatase [Qipengyuania sp. 6B39]|uniref:trehalose-phosphatase n=1 Tax=Qipengyuania proteolytica TaxID=2867239 RepID=UPI001C891CF4|nr:trehalose-phosphatase [Qipengyuania proteolytica]MBX7495452.1 trehalose-phosphatase [Qipengyuania proteolytica]
MASQHTLPSPPSLHELLARGPVALFVDFDGTLVEIAPDPDAIRVPRTLAANIVGLRDRLGGRLAIVSGRALRDLEGHTGPLDVARAGSHGAHRVHADGAIAGSEPPALPEAVVEQLQTFAASQGLRYETKAHGGALHYRSRPECEDAVQAFANRIAGDAGLVVKRGKAVAELVHPGADKAGAVRAFMALEPFAGATPIFIGDDVTDEDGFAGAIEFGGFGVAVGERISDKARYRLDSVTAVHNWLEIR